jgi:hypothetical protein
VILVARARASFLPCLALALLGTATRPAAEVAAVRNLAGGIEATVQIIDRDPSPWKIWSPVRTGIESALLLNPGGDALADGPPSVTVDPATSLPVAVWASRRGGFYQILISRFEGREWTKVTTPHGSDYLALTADAWDNLDPSLSVDQDGSLALVWWRQGGPSGYDEVMMSVKAPGMGWTLPTRVSADGVPARRPSAGFVAGVGAFVAMEQEDPGGTSVVVCEIARDGWPWVQRESDPWGRTIVWQTGSSASLSAEMGSTRTASGLMPVVTWQEGSDLATSVYDPESDQWSDPIFTPYPLW